MQNARQILNSPYFYGELINAMTYTNEHRIFVAGEQKKTTKTGKHLYTNTHVSSTVV